STIRPRRLGSSSRPDPAVTRSWSNRLRRPIRRSPGDPVTSNETPAMRRSYAHRHYPGRTMSSPSASRSLSLGTLVLLLAAPLVAQQGTYVLRSGKDTVAIERFTRSPGRLESESFIPVASAHQKFVAELTPDFGVTRITNDFWMMSD